MFFVAVTGFFFLSVFFFFNDTATTEIYTLSLHDALPILPPATLAPVGHGRPLAARDRAHVLAVHVADHPDAPDRGAAAAGRAATPAPRGGHSERGAAPRGRSRRGLPPALPHAHPRRSWKR